MNKVVLFKEARTYSGDIGVVVVAVWVLVEWWFAVWLLRLMVIVGVGGGSRGRW